MASQLRLGYLNNEINCELGIVWVVSCLKKGLQNLVHKAQERMILLKSVVEISHGFAFNIG